MVRFERRKLSCYGGAANIDFRYPAGLVIDNGYSPAVVAALCLHISCNEKRGQLYPVGKRFKQLSPHKRDIVQPAPAFELAVRHRAVWQRFKGWDGLGGRRRTLCLLRVASARPRQQIKHGKADCRHLTTSQAITWQ